MSWGQTFRDEKSAPAEAARAANDRVDHQTGQSRGGGFADRSNCRRDGYGGNVPAPT